VTKVHLTHVHQSVSHDTDTVFVSPSTAGSAENNYLVCWLSTNVVCANEFLLQCVHKSNDANVCCRQTAQITSLPCKLRHCQICHKSRAAR